MFVVFFFVKHKTAYEMRISDWSSDVCSSDLAGAAAPIADRRRPDLSPVRDLYDGDARLFPAVLSRRPRHRPAVSPGPASGGVVTFDWSVITDNADRFAEGAAMTVLLSVPTMVLAIPGGLLLAFLRFSPVAPIRQIGRAHV